MTLWVWMKEILSINTGTCLLLTVISTFAAFLFDSYFLYFCVSTVCQNWWYYSFVHFCSLDKAIYVQCNLDLVTLNLVTTCDLVTIFERPLFILLHKTNIFSDNMQYSDSFCISRPKVSLNQECTVFTWSKIGKNMLT